MGPKGWLLGLAAAAAIALAVVLLVSTLGSDETEPALELEGGHIFSIDAGDPLDVVYEIDDSGMGCIRLRGLPDRTSGIPYGGSPLCMSLEEVDEGGMYRVLLPVSVEDPALVVGVMPRSATGATVSGVGWKTTRADVRGRWFLASLEPATPDIANLEPIRVRFEY
jgi:hypothetical protein